MTKKVINYVMRNEVNGQAVKISGHGTWTEDGVMALGLEVDNYPAMWSGVIVPCICSGPGPGPVNPKLIEGRSIATVSRGLLSFAPEGYRTVPGTLRRATLFRGDGSRVAVVQATGTYRANTTELDFSIDVKTSTFDPIIEMANSIIAYSFSVESVGSKNLHVYAHYKIGTSVGEPLFGFTEIDYEILGTHSVQAGLKVLGINQINIQRHDRFLQYITAQSTIEASALGS